MNQEIIGIVITQSILFVAALFKIYSDIQLKLKDLDMRMTAVEKRESDMDKKLDKIIDAVIDIKIELKDKLNRDN
jgi:hypothetical protein